MIAWAVFALVWAVVAAVTLAPSALGAGILLGSVVPELAGGVLAWRMERLPRWPLVTVTVVEIVLAVGDLAGGSVRGIVQLVPPVVVLALLVRGYRARAADPYGQGGASLIQYAGLVALAALILGALWAAGIPSTVQARTGTAVCQILHENDCGTPSAQSAKGDRPPPKKDDGAKCHGFWGCTWHYTGGQVWGFVKGVGKSLWQMGDGLVTSILHPSQFVNGISYAVTHPVDALKSIFLGDAEKDWKNGDYGEAIGDVFTNTGSLFIPYADIATGAGDAGKVGKLGELGKLGEAGDLGKAGKLGKLGELAADGDRAAADASKAAKEGDVAGAQKAAKKAENDAKQAEDEGRRNGCKIAALGVLQVPEPPHFGGRLAAPAEDGCTPEEQDALDKAEQDKKKAEQSQTDAVNEKYGIDFRIDDKQFGKKIGKHAKDYGRDPADPASRQWLLDHINDIYRNSDEVRQGPWNPDGGGANDDLFFRKGDDVIVTKNDGEFVTILKGGKDNGWFNGATPKP